MGDFWICDCGLKARSRTYWRNDANLGRRLYECGKIGEDDCCVFFRWDDEPIENPRARKLILELRDAYRATSVENKELREENRELREENRELRQQYTAAEKNVDELCYEVGALKGELQYAEKKMKIAVCEGEKDAKLKRCYKFALILT